MNVNPYNTKDYKDFMPYKSPKNKPNQTQNKPNSNPITEIPKMNVNSYSTKVYQNKPRLRPQQNKPKQTQFLTPLFRVLYTLRGPVFCPLFPDEAGFSFDFVARPVILNTNIWQLRHRWEANTFEPFKTRKETYHVY